MTPDRFLADLLGQRIPGGCPDCHAYQTITAQAPGIWTLIVHHDTTCPTYRQMKGTR